MKPNYLPKTLMLATAVVVASCSAPKLAQRSVADDDVYVTTAKAKEFTAAPARDSQTQTDQYTDDNSQDSYYDANDPYYGTSDPYYGMDYSSRINRFYYGSPWRSYYDTFYGSSYMPWYSQWNNGWYSPGFSFGVYFGTIGWGNGWYNPHRWGNPYGYWGGFYNNPWYGVGSPYYWGGGYYGGGYWGNRNNVYVNPNYGARPVRGRENGSGYIPNRPGNMTGRPDGGLSRRPEQGNPGRVQNTGERPSRPVTTDNRPPRTQTNDRPSRNENPPARQYTPPPSNSGGGRTSSGGGGGGGGGRPTRGGDSDSFRSTQVNTTTRSNQYVQTERPGRTETNYERPARTETYDRPVRTENTDNRPSRAEVFDRPPRTEYTPPPTPVMNNNQSDGGRSAETGSGGGRPTRGGR